jgi:ubiquilin
MSIANITFKVSGQNTNFDMEADTQLTVLDLKLLLEDKANLASGDMRLIYKGKILKDTEILIDMGVISGHTMYVVHGPNAKAKSVSVPVSAPELIGPQGTVFPDTGGMSMNPQMMGQMMDNPMMQTMAQNPQMMQQMMSGQGGMGGTGGMSMSPEMMGQMMDNPMMQQMMQTMAQNPQMMQSMIQNNPMLQQMIQNNPQLEGIINNPQMLQMMMSPQNISMAMQMQHAMRGNPMGGNPMGAIGTGTADGYPMGNPDYSNPMGGSTGGFDMGQMMSAMQNMQGQGMQGQGMQGQGNCMSISNSPTGLPAIGMSPPSTDEQYTMQLQQLDVMGFNDRESNIRALKNTAGDVNAAITKLLE